MNAVLVDAFDEAISNVDQEGEVTKNHTQDPLSSSGFHHRHHPHYIIRMRTKGLTPHTL